MVLPHPDPANPRPIQCAVITLSDTRLAADDRSGQLIQKCLTEAGHQVNFYTLLPDEPKQLVQQLSWLARQTDLDVIITNGGTGVAPRDTTYDAIVPLLDKTLPGFGELFRWLSYQEIGSRAMASRAIAGTYHGKLIFVLPGASNAVRLAMQSLILPELVHLTRQLQRPVS
ncbi:MogA/MoaB family molybdenum cofactor biosynthesis protein [Trichothermofontia sp.]